MRSKHISIIILFMFLFNILFVFNPGFNVAATNITVGAVGGDYLTITEAVENSSNGDNIFVWAGTYTESINVDKSVNIIGNGTDQTIIQSNNYGFNITVDNITISDLNITMLTTDEGAAVYIPDQIENLTVRNVSFYDEGANIYADTSDCRNFVIDNNTFTSTDGGVFFDVDIENIIISNNTFLNIDSECIFFDMGVTNLDFENNTITNSTVGLVAYYGENFNIRNNTFTGITCDGSIIETHESITGEISNNTFTTSTHETGAIFIEETTYVNIENNTFTSVYSSSHFSEGALITYPCIFLQKSNYSDIIYNTFESCGSSISISGTHNNTISYNTFRNCTNDDNSSITIMDVAGVTHGFISDCVISENYINNCYYGITFYQLYQFEVDFNVQLDHKGSIYNNTILDCNYGLHIDFSDGIILDNSSDFYNNYLANDDNILYNYGNAVKGTSYYNVSETSDLNILNASAFGGNYWRDYTGFDNNSDGFGDTPYILADQGDHVAADYLPLMEADMLVINVYNESNCTQTITDFDVQVSNFEGTQVYSQENCVSSVSIPVALCPRGEKVSVLVSSSGYKQRVYYLDLEFGSNYLIDAYLPPFYFSDDSEIDENTCGLRSFTNSISVSNPDSQAQITFTHTPLDIISVEIYNATLFGTYGGWYFLPQDYYTATETSVTISASYLDSNTEMARVSYYYLSCPSQVIETPLYYLRLVETVSKEYDTVDRGVSDTYVKVKRYMSCEEKYVNMSVLLTDANGYFNLYLMPNILYKVEVNASGYEYMISDYIPAPPNEWGQTEEKVFRIQSIGVNTTPTMPSENIVSASVSVIMNESYMLTLHYLDIGNLTNSVLFQIYDGDTLLFSDTNTSTPNDAWANYNFSGVVITNSLIQINFLVTLTNGTVVNFVRYFDISQAALGDNKMPAPIAFILSVTLLFFGLTIASSKQVFGVIGIFVIIIAIAITAFATQTWYIHLIQGVDIILLIYALLIFKEEGLHAV